MSSTDGPECQDLLALEIPPQRKTHADLRILGFAPDERGFLLQDGSDFSIWSGGQERHSFSYWRNSPQPVDEVTMDALRAEIGQELLSPEQDPDPDFDHSYIQLQGVYSASDIFASPKVIATSRDGHWLAEGYWNGQVNLLGPDSITNSRTVRPTETSGVSFSQAISVLVFSPESPSLFIGTYGGAIEIRDITSGKLISATHVEGQIFALATSRDGKHVAVQSSNDQGQRLLYYGVRKGLDDGLKLRKISSNSPLGIDLSADGKFLISGLHAHADSVWVLNLETGKRIYRSRPSTAGFSIPESRTVFFSELKSSRSAENDSFWHRDTLFDYGAHRRIDLTTANLYRGREKSGIADVAGWDGIFIVGREDGELLFIQAESGSVLFSFYPRRIEHSSLHGDPHMRFLNSLAVSPSGNWLLLGYTTGKMIRLDLKALRARIGF